MALFDNVDCLLSTPVAVSFVKGLGIPFLELPPLGSSPRLLIILAFTPR